MSPASKHGAAKSVAQLVADWRERQARGEHMDVHELLCAIEQSDAQHLPGERLASGTADNAAADQATLSLRGGQGDASGTPTAAFERPSSRIRRFARASGPANQSADGLADYDILREIAHGGMGIVFEARQRSLNRIVALKMIKAAQLADEEDVARFYAEAEAAANLRHPNIVAVYEVGRANDGQQHYFTMDYVAGPSLLELIRQQPLDARRAAGYVAKVARAIQFAHERGVLHRDLKPSNILLGEDDEPRVTDFGLAKRIDRDSQLTIAGAVVGTPSYMPPEQARGDLGQIGPRSDVYSLGAVLFECVTGRPPFVGASFAEVVNMVLTEEPLAPSRLTPRLPRDLETICLKCLEKEPTRRYASAGELAGDLERFLADEPIRARPIRLVERAVKFARRKPAWAALATVLTLSVVILAGTIATYTSRLSATNSELHATNADLLRTNYAALIDKTEDYWSRDPRNLARGKDLLMSLVPASGEQDLRGIEWYFLRRLCDLDDQEVYQGSDQVQHLCCRADGGLLVHDLAREDSLIVLGSTRERQSIAAGNVARLLFAPHSPWCLAWTSDKKLELRSSQSPGSAGELVGSGVEQDNPASFSADGSLVALLPEGQPPALWRRAEPDRIRALTTSIEKPIDLRLSPDGKWAAVMAKEKFSVVNIEAHKTNRIDPPSGRRRYTALAFSPDSQRLALASQEGQLDVVLLSDKITLVSLKLKTDFAMPYALEFLPDGKRLAIGSSNARVLIVNLRADVVGMTEQETVSYRGHRASVRGLAADPSGAFLYSSAQDGQVLRWNLAISDQRTHDIRELTGAWYMHFDFLSYSPDGRWLAAGGRSYEAGPEAPTGRLLIIDARTRAVRHRLSAPQPITACSFSSDSKLLIYGAAGGSGPARFNLWNVALAKPMGEVAALAAAHFACFAGADRIVFAGADGGLYASQLAGGKSEPCWRPAVTGQPPAPIGQLIASAEGSLIAGLGAGHVVRLWDPLGRQLSQSDERHRPTAMSLSADGNLAAWTTPYNGAANSQREQQAIVFDLPQNEVRHSIGGHSTPIQSLALSADGKRLASGDEEGVLKLWDTATGQELLAIEDAQPGGVKAIAFHPGGRQMASIGSNAMVRIWWTE